MRFLGGPPVPLEDVPAVIEKWIRRWEVNGLGTFVVERRDDGAFVGRAGLLVWDARTWTTQTALRAGDEHAQPELGWALVREHWGHGYATEAAVAARDWVRRERGIVNLVSLIAPGNVRSQAVARRLGAERTKTVRLFDSGDAEVWVHPATPPHT
jgi:RimJ/RimL family protein N-acetyltransferase